MKRKTFETNLIDNAIRKMSEDIARQKETIILQRLKSIGIEVDMKEEDKRRFNRFKLEVQDNKETLYYNDGSINGLRVITFVKTNIPFNLKDNNFTLGYEENYY